MSARSLDLEATHRASFANREAVLASERAGCFSCLASFAIAQIDEWADERCGGQTALCPRCGIDAVLPMGVLLLGDGQAAVEVRVDEDFLRRMRWRDFDSQ